MEHVEQGRVSKHSFKLKDQVADILTKPLPKQDYKILRDILLGDNPNPPGLQGSVQIEIWHP